MRESTPVRLMPAFKDYIWGGRKLVTEYNKRCDWQTVAESWELSTHHDGESIVSDGCFAGATLSEYIRENEYDVLGENAKRFEFFPILIKFIDAREFLSVQVHPNDEYSLKHNGEYGKTEMWYILDCEEDAYLYYGFEHEISKEELACAIKNNTLLELLHKEKVKKGDVLMIEAGTVHAIGSGMVICEVQQNSNSTYRVYDYNRVGKDGKPRQLHIKEAMEVSLTTPPRRYIRQGELLAKCDYFRVEEKNIAQYGTVAVSEASFCSIIVADGSGELTMGEYRTEINKGDSVFIPAQNGAVEITGECKLIVTSV